MNPVIEKIYREQRVIGPGGREINPFPISIKRPEGDALYQIVRQENASATLEVGMAWGLSTMFMCQALRDNGGGRHVAMDPFQTADYAHAGVRHVTEAGLADLLEFYEDFSHLALPRLLEQKRQFDVIFVDGSHLFDHVLVDFFYTDCLLKVGGCLIFDDLWMPAVRKALHFILRNRRYEIVEKYLGPKPPFLKRHWQNLSYQTRKLIHGRKNLGAPPENRFHLLHNVNWTVFRKQGDDRRPWEHFVGF